MIYNTVSSEIYDPSGFVELPAIETRNPLLTRRRINRVATMDGSAVLNDGGFSDSDRQIEIEWQATDKVTADAVERIAQLYTRVRISVRSGVYLAALDSFDHGEVYSRLRLLVLSKLSS